METITATFRSISLHDVTDVGYMTQCNVCCVSQGIMKIRSREIDDFDIILFQNYWSTRRGLCQ